EVLPLLAVLRTLITVVLLSSDWTSNWPVGLPSPMPNHLLVLSQFRLLLPDRIPVPVLKASWPLVAEEVARVPEVEGRVNEVPSVPPKVSVLFTVRVLPSAPAKVNPPSKATVLPSAILI